MVLKKPRQYYWSKSRVMKNRRRRINKKQLIDNGLTFLIANRIRLTKEKRKKINYKVDAIERRALI
jgi:hypothetical protein